MLTVRPASWATSPVARCGRPDEEVPMSIAAWLLFMCGWVVCLSLVMFGDSTLR